MVNKATSKEQPGRPTGALETYRPNRRPLRPNVHQATRLNKNMSGGDLIVPSDYEQRSTFLVGATGIDSR